MQVIVWQGEGEIPHQSPHTTVRSDREYGGSLNIMRFLKHFQN